jgi:hypothetical protein
MSTSEVNSMPALRARPTLVCVTNGATGIDSQQTMRSVNFVWKYVRPSRTRFDQKFWSTPKSYEKLFSGFRSGLAKPGKNRSLNVGARKPEPAPPRMRVPHSLMW